MVLPTFRHIFTVYIPRNEHSHDDLYTTTVHSAPHLHTYPTSLLFHLIYIYSKIDAFVARLHTANTQQRTINIQMILVGGIDRVHSSRHPVPNKSLQSVFFLKVLLFFCCLSQSSLRFNLTWLVFRICETTVLDWKRKKDLTQEQNQTNNIHIHKESHKFVSLFLSD